MRRQQELTKHLRKIIAQSGIKARVRQLPTSNTGIQVVPTGCGVEFSEDEQRQIRMIASVNHMTLVRGLPIVVEQMTNPHGMEFHI